MKERQEVNYRVGMAMSIVLISIAGVFDIFSLIPFVGTVFAPIFWIGIGVYFWTKGISLFDGKKLATSAISFLAELFPVVQTLPMLTAGIIAILLMMRIEDKTGLSIAHPLKKGVTPPRIERKPLNTNGIREPRRGNIGSYNTNKEKEVEEISLAE